MGLLGRLKELLPVQNQASSEKKLEEKRGDKEFNKVGYKEKRELNQYDVVCSVTPLETNIDRVYQNKIKYLDKLDKKDPKTSEIDLESRTDSFTKPAATGIRVGYRPTFVSPFSDNTSTVPIISDLRISVLEMDVDSTFDRNSKSQKIATGNLDSHFTVYSKEETDHLKKIGAPNPRNPREIRPQNAVNALASTYGDRFVDFQEGLGSYVVNQDQAEAYQELQYIHECFDKQGVFDAIKIPATDYSIDNLIAIQKDLNIMMDFAADFLMQHYSQVILEFEKENGRWNDSNADVQESWIDSHREVLNQKNGISEDNMDTKYYNSLSSTMDALGRDPEFNRVVAEQNANIRLINFTENKTAAEDSNRGHRVDSDDLLKVCAMSIKSPNYTTKSFPELTRYVESITGQTPPKCFRTYCDKFSSYSNYKEIPVFIGSMQLDQAATQLTTNLRKKDMDLPSIKAESKDADIQIKYQTVVKGVYDTPNNNIANKNPMHTILKDAQDIGLPLKLENGSAVTLGHLMQKHIPDSFTYGDASPESLKKINTNMSEMHERIKTETKDLEELKSKKTVAIQKLEADLKKNPDSDSIKRQIKDKTKEFDDKISAKGTERVEHFAVFSTLQHLNDSHPYNLVNQSSRDSVRFVKEYRDSTGITARDGIKLSESTSPNYEHKVKDLNSCFDCLNAEPNKHEAAIFKAYGAVVKDLDELKHSDKRIGMVDILSVLHSKGGSNTNAKGDTKNDAILTELAKKIDPESTHPDVKKHLTQLQSVINENAEFQTGRIIAKEHMDRVLFTQEDISSRQEGRYPGPDTLEFFLNHGMLNEYKFDSKDSLDAKADKANPDGKSSIPKEPSGIIRVSSVMPGNTIKTLSDDDRAAAKKEIIRLSNPLKLAERVCELRQIITQIEQEKVKLHIDTNVSYTNEKPLRDALSSSERVLDNYLNSIGRDATMGGVSNKQFEVRDIVCKPTDLAQSQIILAEKSLINNREFQRNLVPEPPSNSKPSETPTQTVDAPEFKQALKNFEKTTFLDKERVFKSMHSMGAENIGKLSDEESRNLLLSCAIRSDESENKKQIERHKILNKYLGTEIGNNVAQISANPNISNGELDKVATTLNGFIAHETLDKDVKFVLEHIGKKEMQDIYKKYNVGVTDFTTLKDKTEDKGTPEKIEVILKKGMLSNIGITSSFLNNRDYQEKHVLDLNSSFADHGCTVMTGGLLKTPTEMHAAIGGTLTKSPEERSFTFSQQAQIEAESTRSVPVLLADYNKELLEALTTYQENLRGLQIDASESSMEKFKEITEVNAFLHIEDPAERQKIIDEIKRVTDGLEVNTIYNSGVSTNLDAEVKDKIDAFNTNEKEFYEEKINKLKVEFEDYSDKSKFDRMCVVFTTNGSKDYPDNKFSPDQLAIINEVREHLAVSPESRQYLVDTLETYSKEISATNSAIEPKTIIFANEASKFSNEELEKHVKDAIQKSGLEDTVGLDSKIKEYSELFSQIEAKQLELNVTNNLIDITNDSSKTVGDKVSDPDELKTIMDNINLTREKLEAQKNDIEKEINTLNTQKNAVEENIVSLLDGGIDSSNKQEVLEYQKELLENSSFANQYKYMLAFSNSDQDSIVFLNAEGEKLDPIEKQTEFAQNGNEDYKKTVEEIKDLQEAFGNQLIKADGIVDMDVIDNVYQKMDIYYNGNPIEKLANDTETLNKEAEKFAVEAKNAAKEVEGSPNQETVDKAVDKAKEAVDAANTAAEEADKKAEEARREANKNPSNSVDQKFADNAEKSATEAKSFAAEAITALETCEGKQKEFEANVPAPTSVNDYIGEVTQGANAQFKEFVDKKLDSETKTESQEKLFKSLGLEGCSDADKSTITTELTNYFSIPDSEYMKQTIPKILLDVCDSEEKLKEIIPLVIESGYCDDLKKTAQIYNHVCIGSKDGNQDIADSQLKFMEDCITPIVTRQQETEERVRPEAEDPLKEHMAKLHELEDKRKNTIDVLDSANLDSKISELQDNFKPDKMLKLYKEPDTKDLFTLTSSNLTDEGKKDVIHCLYLEDPKRHPVTPDQIKDLTAFISNEADEKEVVRYMIDKEYTYSEMTSIFEAIGGKESELKACVQNIFSTDIEATFKENAEAMQKEREGIQGEMSAEDFVKFVDTLDDVNKRLVESESESQAAAELS